VGLLVFAVAVVVFAFFLARSRRERENRRAAAATVRLTVDDWGVKRWLADGRYEEVAWDELQEVRAITLPKGPWGNRIRLVYDGGGERGCIVPIDVAEQFGVLGPLTGVPGFDHRALADVLDQERTGQQVLWQRVGPTTT